MFIRGIFLDSNKLGTFQIFIKKEMDFLKL